MRIFATDNFIGALAHLARAFDWQSKGDEFESRMLHTKKTAAWLFFLCEFIMCILSCLRSCAFLPADNLHRNR